MALHRLDRRLYWSAWRAGVRVGVVVLAIPALAFVSRLIWANRELAAIERLDLEAQRFRGSAGAMPESVDLLDKTISLSLDLNRANLGDEEFASLARMPAFRHLHALGLSETRITDRTLELLAGNPSMTLLDLSRTKVTDDGVRSITKLPRLRELYLSGTAVTDRGLDALIGNSASMVLRSIDLRDTNVSKDGILRLSRAFEHIEIEHSFGKELDDRR